MSDISCFLMLHVLSCVHTPGVGTYSLHPGTVQSEIWRHVKFPASIVMSLICTLFFKVRKNVVMETSTHVLVALISSSRI